MKPENCQIWISEIVTVYQFSQEDFDFFSISAPHEYYVYFSVREEAKRLRSYTRPVVFSFDLMMRNTYFRF